VVARVPPCHRTVEAAANLGGGGPTPVIEGARGAQCGVGVAKTEGGAKGDGSGGGGVKTNESE
jgi:hypothetical protein